MILPTKLDAVIQEHIDDGPQAIAQAIAAHPELAEVAAKPQLLAAINTGLEKAKARMVYGPSKAQYVRQEIMALA